MPTTAGIPLSQMVASPELPAGPLNQFDWIDGAGNMPGAQQASLMRGHPGAMAYWQRRQIPQVPTMPQPREVFMQAPTWDRGAGAFSPKFGVVPISPIGAGVYAPYRIPTIAGPGARYQFAAIWFDVQTIPTSMTLSPSMSAESLNALIQESYVAGTYLTTG
jgi:hypothetical protein